MPRETKVTEGWNHQDRAGHQAEQTGSNEIHRSLSATGGSCRRRHGQPPLNQKKHRETDHLVVLHAAGRQNILRIGG